MEQFKKEYTYITRLQYDSDIRFNMNILEREGNRCVIAMNQLDSNFNELPSEIYKRKIKVFEGTEFIDVSDGIVFCADRFM